MENMTALIERQPVTITPAEAASVLGMNPQYLRTQLRATPTMFGFAVLISGNRIRIPFRPFAAYLGYEVPAPTGAA